MLSKLANNRFICQGCCNHHRARAEKRLSKQEMETDLKDWDAFFFLFFSHTFTYWFEKYTNSLAEEPFILAICYVK